ncbi:MAG TPA: lipid II flippase MurJ [Pyrinomonadaceae bacterium]|nr:lipid II flippase MurJ [Pyrinomonadaceae bacterium]
MVEDRMEIERKLVGYETTNDSLPWARRAWHGSFVFRQGVNLAALAFCNASLAVLSAWYIVTRTGINFRSDAFFASSALPQLAFGLLSATLVPVLVPLLATKNQQQLRQDGWALFQLITGISLLVAVPLFALADLWVPLLVPGFSGEGKNLTIALTRIQIVSMVLNAAIVTLAAVHHALRRFVWVELSALIANMAGLLFLVFALPRFGIVIAALSIVFHNILKLIFLLPALGRWRRPVFHSPTVTDARRLLKPLLPGQAYQRTEPLLDRFLSSMNGAGSLSLFSVAQQIYANVSLVTMKTLVSPLIPKLAVEAGGDWRAYRHTYRKRLLLIACLACAGVVLLIFGERILSFAIGHAGVTRENVYSLWLIMIALGGLFGGVVLGQIVSAAFYAAGNTKTPAKVSAIVYTIYLPFKIVMFLRYGVVGLGITVSAYCLTNFLVQLVMLERDVARKLENRRTRP